jgi:hypothetical protein
MKHLIVTIAIFTLTYQFLSAQTSFVISYGDTLSNLIGQQGIVDKNENRVMIGKRFAVKDNPHVAFFDSTNKHKWSFYIDNKSATANKIIQTKDGHYIALYSNGISSQLIKFTNTGTILWYKDHSNIYSFIDAIEDTTTSNVYFIGSLDGKLILMSLNPSGNLVASTAFSLTPASSYLFAQSIGITHDGNLILCAVASYLGGPNAKPVVIKSTKQGGIIWSSVFSSTTSNMLIDKLIESKIDHSFFGVGYRSTGVANTFDAFSLKLDTGGNYVNNKSIEFTYQDNYYDVCEAPNGGFVAIGMTKPVAVCGGNLFMTKFSANNDTAYHKTYGTANGNGAFFFNIAPHKSGGFQAFGTGSLWSILKVPYDYNFIKTDSLLELPCKKYNQAFNQSTLAITQANNVITTTYTPAFTTTYVQLFDSMQAADGCNGIVLATNNFNKLEDNFTIYPVPASNEITINAAKNANYSFTIYTIDGKLIHQSATNKYSSKLNTSSWSDGTYLIQITMENKQKVFKKIIINRSF